MVRFDTYNASAHLVRQIEQSTRAKVKHDGGDNILIELTSGHLISIYLIETIIPPYEIRTTLESNGNDNICTLFILWGAMFIPDHGDLFIPDEWLSALIELYGDKIYAFDAFGKDIEIYPVHFQHYGKSYRIHHGAHLDVTTITCDEVEIQRRSAVSGVWRVAHFSAEEFKQLPPANVPIRHNPAWDTLEIVPTTDVEAIKTAYRRLARLYHPDLSISKDATTRMQAINAAYAMIMQELGQN